MEVPWSPRAGRGHLAGGGRGHRGRRGARARRLRGGARRRLPPRLRRSRRGVLPGQRRGHRDARAAARRRGGPGRDRGPRRPPRQRHRVHLRGDADTFTLSLHQEHNYPAVKPPSDDRRRPAPTAPATTRTSTRSTTCCRARSRRVPDLLWYLAGADPYEHDLLGGLGAHPGRACASATAASSTAARRAGVPVAVTLAGGYAARTARHRHHPRDTVAAAAECCGGGRLSGDARSASTSAGPRSRPSRSTPTGASTVRRRVPTPRDDYEGTLAAIAGLVDGSSASWATRQRSASACRARSRPPPASSRTRTRSGSTGAASPTTSRALPRPLRFANDANCFALSEAIDGAGRGRARRLRRDHRHGHGRRRRRRRTRLGRPEWRRAASGATTRCPGRATTSGRARRATAGSRGCIETFLSGPGLARDHARVTGARATARGDRRAGGRGRRGGGGDAGALRRPAGARPGHGRQPARPRGDRARRRAVQHRARCTTACRRCCRDTSSPTRSSRRLRPPVHGDSSGRPRRRAPVVARRGVIGGPRDLDSQGITSYACPPGSLPATSIFPTTEDQPATVALKQ